MRSVKPWLSLSIVAAVIAAAETFLPGPFLSADARANEIGPAGTPAAHTEAGVPEIVEAMASAAARPEAKNDDSLYELGSRLAAEMGFIVFEAIPEIKDPRSRDELALGAVEALVKVDPGKTARAAMVIELQEGGAEPRIILKTVLDRWSATEPRDAANWIVANMEDDSMKRALRSVLKGWMAQDARAAMAWGAAVESKPVKALAVAEVAPVVAKTDPIAAFNALLTLPDGLERKEGLAASLAVWAEMDREAALVWMKEHFALSSQPGMLANVAAACAKRDPAHALKVALGWLRQTDEADQAVATAVTEMAQKDLRATAEMLAPFAATQAAAFAYHELAEAWAERDPSTFLSWVDSLPEAPSRREAANVAAMKLPEAEFRQWIPKVAAWPVGQSRDAALLSIVHRISKSVPEQAISYAELITEPAFRHEAMQYALNHWSGAAREQAEAWMQAHPDAKLSLPGEEEGSR